MTLFHKFFAIFWSKNYVIFLLLFFNSAVKQSVVLVYEIVYTSTKQEHLDFLVKTVMLQMLLA